MREKNKVGDLVSPEKGFFSFMNYDFKIVEKSQLDLMFFGLFAQKTVSPFCYHYMHDLENGKISDESLQSLSNIILAYYKVSWDKLLTTLDIEYDPIHNFSDDLVENIKGSDDKILTENVTITKQGNGSVTRTDNLTSTETKDLLEKTDGNVKDDIAGFNSSNYKAANRDTTDMTVKNSGTDTITNTGTQIRDEQRNFQDIDEGTHVTDDDYARERKVKRIGNIGNITTQQMIQQEIDLWKQNFVRLILDNVRDLITLEVYL